MYQATAATADQAASKVDLPNPASATTVVSRWVSTSANRACRAAHTMNVAGTAGGTTFVMDIELNGGCL